MRKSKISQEEKNNDLYKLYFRKTEITFVLYVSALD